MSDIEISAEPPKPITLTLIGEDYTVRPIKGSLGIALSQRLQNIGEDPAKLQQGINTLTTAIFGKKDGKKIKERLEDPEDLLDIPHILDLLNKLVERASGNPTT